MQKSYIIMIAHKQYQPQPTVFSTKILVADKKVDLSSSVLAFSAFRERQPYKKKIAKRSSCHNMGTDNRENQSEQFSNKLLEHIFTQIKHNSKPLQRQANEPSIIHAIVQRANSKPNNECKQLNQDNNLKIKSIHNLIQPKSKSTHRNTKNSTPFQNKKLMNLRKGKSYSLYTQEIEPQITEPSNEGKILPWELFNNHIIDLPGATTQIDEETAEQHYLKSQGLKPKDSKALSKYNTLDFSPPEEKKPSYKKYSSIEISRAEKHKKNSTRCNQIFSAHALKQQSGRCARSRCKQGSVNRTLTQMKMDIEEIQLDKPESANRKIKIDDLFECIIPREIFSRKPTINQSYRPPQSIPRQTNEVLFNCFLKGRKI